MAWLRDVDRWLIEAVLPHGQAFRRAAARVVGADEADDIVHDAYARLLGYAAWREIASPRAFCLTTIRNLALERLRRDSIVGIDRIASLDAIEIEDHAPDAFRQTAGRMELAAMLRAIDDLPPQCGRVVKLRKLEGLGPSEIAVSLGISVSTVETHLAKGLARLTERLRETEAKDTNWPKSWARRRERSS
jgi:RNA polymerase sigma factor (sigma-70 family)